MPFAADDADGIEHKASLENMRLIITAHSPAILEAAETYRNTLNMDALFFALLPIRNKIRYEAYAPYWLSHCKPVDERDSETGFTYYNDLVDMYWAWQWQEWKKKDKWCVAIMLPPTKGLIELSYREDRKYLKEYLENTEADALNPMPYLKYGTGR